MSDKLQEATSGPVVPEGGFSGWIAGRANRRSYWLFVGPSIVVIEVTALLGMPWGRWLVIIPILFAMIRRFHDLGRSGWLAPLVNIATNVIGFGLRAFTPQDVGLGLTTLLYYGVLLTLGLIPGQPRRNEFGPPPGLKKADLKETFS
jgi:uncharacterized membrane protein YhaH (DUF805 family)